MKKNKFLSVPLALALLALLFSCGNASKVVGHYSYQHGWAYPMQEGYIVVHETGTMDFKSHGGALDSAQQVYKLLTPDSTQITWVFNYVSPSRWSLDGEDFYFSGIDTLFRMQLLSSTVEGNSQLYDSVWVSDFAQRVIRDITMGIGQNTKFHLDTLNNNMLKWGYTYPDGHSDTWVFFR